MPGVAPFLGSTGPQEYRSSPYGESVDKLGQVSFAEAEVKRSLSHV
jgi:hypothetical protein